MISQLRRHEIRVLLKAGFSVREVASRTGLSVATVRRVQIEGPEPKPEGIAAAQKKRVGRPSKAAPFGGRVEEWLSEEPSLATSELLRRAKREGYQGSKTAFYELVAGLRAPRQLSSSRDKLPGQFSQHDFGDVELPFSGGHSERVRFFASQLQFSQYSQVSVVSDDRLETIVRCLARDFAALGGLPLMAVFDSSGPIVKTVGAGNIVVHEVFAQAVVDIGIGVEMRSSQDSDSLLGWLKRCFLPGRTFRNRNDLQAQLSLWLDEVNAKRHSPATGEVPVKLREQELPYLRAISTPALDLALRVPIVVDPAGMVSYDGASYAMPPEAAHAVGTLFLYEDRVRIVASRFEVEYDRGDASRPRQEPRKLEAVAPPAAVTLEDKRREIRQLGVHARQLLAEVVRRDPASTSRRIEELYLLVHEHGGEKVRVAVERAFEVGHVSVTGVRRFLDTESDEETRASHRSGPMQLDLDYDGSSQGDH